MRRPQVYLDITDDVKFAWKAQRDIAERGATMEEVQAAIDARKPDFAAYVEPQKAKADIVVQAIAITILFTMMFDAGASLFCAILYTP